MKNKIIITNEEWQKIFDSIWDISNDLDYEDIGFIEFKGHKYHFLGSFTDFISDDVIKEDNQADYLDEDEINEDSYCRLCRTMLVRDDKTIWYFYIYEGGSASTEITHYCGEEYMDLVENEEIPEHIQEILEKI